MSEEQSREDEVGDGEVLTIEVEDRTPTRSAEGQALSTGGDIYRGPWWLPLASYWSRKCGIWGLVGLLFWLFHDFLSLIVITFVVSYLAESVTEWLQARSGFGRQPLVTGIFLALLTGVIVGSVIALPRAAREVEKIYHEAPTTARKVRETVTQAVVDFWEYTEPAVATTNGTEDEAADGAPGDAATPTSTTTALDQGPEPDGAAAHPHAPEGEKGEAGKVGLKDLIKPALDQMGKALAGIWMGAKEFLGSTMRLMFHFFLSLIFSFLILFDLPRLSEGMRMVRSSRLGAVYEEVTPHLVEFFSILGKVFEAQILIASFNMVLTFLGLVLLGVPYPVTLCLLVFFCGLIPILGVWISSAPIVLVALKKGGFVLGFKVVAVITIIHLLEAYVFNPKIMGDHLKIHPFLVLVILLVGEHFFGVWGLLLGVPVSIYIVRDLLGVDEPAEQGLGSRA